MDRVTRCLHCGERLVPVLTVNGRTDLKCVWCDKIDPMDTDVPRWGDSPSPASVTPRPWLGH